MSSPQALGVGPLVLAFVAGCALATAVAVIVSRTATPQPSALVPTDDSHAGIERELHEIRATLDELRRSLALQTARPDANQREVAQRAPPENPELARLEQTLAEHAATLSELRTRASSATDRGVSLAERRQRSPEPNWNALNAWLDVARKDGNAERALVQLLTYEDVLERYGTPSDVRFDHEYGLTWWQYVRGEPDGDGQSEVRIQFGFADGRVVRESHAEYED